MAAGSALPLNFQPMNVKKKKKPKTAKISNFSKAKRGRGSSAQARGRSKSPRKSSKTKKGMTNSLEMGISPSEFYNILTNNFKGDK